VDLCRAAGARGGTAPAALNAANEACVEAFLAGRLSFPRIVETVARVVEDHDFRERPTLAEVLETEAAARDAARRLVGTEV
jgi:1-deoxy-D-xylulose-5-phosphate reductoisomerase